jgi:hypothetical protein
LPYRLVRTSWKICCGKARGWLNATVQAWAARCSTGL